MNATDTTTEKKEKKPLTTDRQLSTTLIGIISIIAGLGVLAFGGLTISGNKTINSLIQKAPIVLDAAITGALMIISGLILIVAGIGVWRTMNWAFYLYLAGFIVAVVFILAFFSTNILAKLGLVVTGAILGALLGESEYYRGRKSKEDVDVAFLVDFVVYGSMSIGVVGALVGIAGLIDHFALKTGFFENLLKEASGNNSILSDPVIVGSLAIVAGIIFVISGYGLSKERSWAWYVYVVGFLVVILVIFLMSPLELEFALPSAAILLISLSLGSLIANYEYFTN